MSFYRRVEIVDGESAEPVQFVAVHPVRWPSGLEPQAAFVEASIDEDAVEALVIAARELLSDLEAEAFASVTFGDYLAGHVFGDEVVAQLRAALETWPDEEANE